jgi:molybdopterin-guanine dinucleotide biosynthesis protein A
MMGEMKRKIRCGGKPMTAIVLAGGRGRRMKADKAGLRVGGRTLLEHVLAQIPSLMRSSWDYARAATRFRSGRGPEGAPGRYSYPRLVEAGPGPGTIGGILAG